jgi:Lipopolysaccharide-assembly
MESRALSMTRSLIRTSLLGCVVLVAGCNYSFRSGSFPEHIRTVAILPFDNETTRFELTQEIHEQLLRDLPRALGITNAGEDVADAIVRGTITRYTLSTPLFRPGQQQDQVDVLQREVSVSIRVEFVDVANNEILWEEASLSVKGQYLEESEGEDDGRAEAIELLVQRIVDGAQSNW